MGRGFGAALVLNDVGRARATHAELFNVIVHIPRIFVLQYANTTRVENQTTIGRKYTCTKVGQHTHHRTNYKKKKNGDGNG